MALPRRLSLAIPTNASLCYHQAKPKPPKAPKALPTDAESRHPVMLLHEMRPNTTFEVTEQRLASAGAPSSITVTAYVDGLEFKASGE